MELTVEIVGLKGVEDALSQAGPKLAKRALRKALVAGAELFEAAAKKNAPVLAKATPNRRPGELRDAIDMTVKLSGKQESGIARVAIRRDKGKGGQSPAVWWLLCGIRIDSRCRSAIHAARVRTGESARAGSLYGRDQQGRGDTRQVIEQGFVQLVQGTSAVNTIAATGGFLAELPKDQALPSWSYTTVADSAGYVLAGPLDLGSWNVQIDCYAATREQAVLLAAAIDTVRNGYAGTLADPDSTVVQGIFRINKRDFFDDARRTYRRMLEYEVWSNGCLGAGSFLTFQLQ